MPLLTSGNNSPTDGPMSSSLSEEVQEILGAIEKVRGTKLSETDKHELKRAMDDLREEVQDPWDSLHDLAFIQPALAVSMKVLTDLKLFEKWTAAGGEPKSSAELAEMVHVDAGLLVRLLQMAGSVKLISVSQPDMFEMNQRSRALAHPSQVGTINLLFDLLQPAYLSLPQFLAGNGYTNPSQKMTSTSINWAKNTKGTLFEYWTSRPAEQEDFANCMAGYNGNLASWTDFFPTEELFAVKSEKALVVDIGGGTGNDLRHIAKKHSIPKERLILQELSSVLTHTVPENIFIAQEHDFFQPQPVKGAVTYMFHSVLHNWTDENAFTILRNVKDAMGPESRILVHELVLRPVDNPPLATQMDLLMMSLLNASIRTEGMWKKLFESVGLKIVKTYTCLASPHSIMEVVPNER